MLDGLGTQLSQLHRRIVNSWVPHEFWGYTTVVMDRTMSVRDDQAGYNILRDWLIATFRAAGIEAHVDNKIAFGLVRKDGSSGLLYVGFYDWHVDVGTDVRPDSWLKAKRPVVPAAVRGT